MKQKLKSLMRTTVFALSLAGLASEANAGLTWFSRANCINNESISWDAWDSHWLWTNSEHYRGGYYQHCENNAGNACTGGSWQLTWRAAGIHWNEGYSGGWYVRGFHWRWTSTAGTHLLGVTGATGCNLSQW